MGAKKLQPGSKYEALDLDNDGAAFDPNNLFLEATK